MKISDRDGAERLAKAIAVDLRVYHADRLAAENPWQELQAEIAEGRKLYDTRVTPELRVLYDQVLRAEIPELGAAPLPVEPPVPSLPQGVSYDSHSPDASRGTNDVALIVGGLALLFAIALAGWWIATYAT